MGKKIFIKVSLLLVIIICLNFIYNSTFYKMDVKNRSHEMIEILRSQVSTDVFYFGESSNTTFIENDSIKSSISEMINLFYPSLKLATINKPATHAGIYKYWLKQIIINKKLPKAIIVTLNLRSFGAPWRYSKLESHTPEWITLTEPYPNLFNRFQLSLLGFADKTDQQREYDLFEEWKSSQLNFSFPVKYNNVADWNYAIAHGGFLNSDGTWNQQKIELACHYVKAYAFNIKDDNIRVKDFDEIALWCKQNNVNLYLNLMAENIHYADSLVGKELVFLMRQNRDFLVKRYNKNNCFVIDNLEMVSGKEFIDQNWTTEHYNYKGRMIIAKNVAKSLENQFLKEYKKVY